MMITDKSPNIKIVENAAAYLGLLINEMVFTGGCATGLLITDPAAHPVRATMDVDMLVEISSLANYYALSEKLRSRGFVEDLSPEAPICRWKRAELLLDVMPTNPDILGFGNKWYAPAFAASKWIQLSSGTKIRILPAPYFLATKFEAFDGRGQNDYLMSRDMEDIVTLLDGRSEIVEEVKNTDKQLSTYLLRRLANLLENQHFLEALPGHLPADPVSQARADLIIARMKNIIGG